MLKLLGGIATGLCVKRVMCKYDEKSPSHVMTLSMNESYLTWVFA